MNRKEISDIQIPRETYQPIIMDGNNDSFDELDSNIREIKLNRCNEFFYQWFFIYVLCFLVLASFFIGLELGAHSVRVQAIKAGVGRFIPQLHGPDKFRFLP